MRAAEEAERERIRVEKRQAKERRREEAQARSRMAAAAAMAGDGHQNGRGRQATYSDGSIEREMERRPNDVSAGEENKHTCAYQLSCKEEENYEAFC